jgi:hypothetical protein
VTKLAEALSKAQSQLQPLIKTKTVDSGSFKYMYADLADVIENAKKALSENGLSFIQKLDFHPNGQLCLETVLMHASGESVSSFYPLPDPKSIKPQDFGKLLTYSRRYALSAILGIASEDDTDGHTDTATPRTAAIGKPQVIRQTSVHKEVQKQMAARNDAPPDDHWYGDPGPQPEASFDEIFPINSSTSDYVVPFGKYSGKKLSDIKPEELRNYVNYLKDSSAKSGKPIERRTLEFVNIAQTFLN